MSYLKRCFERAVFEELPSADNASGFRSAVTSGPSSATTTPLEPPPAGRLQRADSQESQSRPCARSSRVLVASRHLRSDSKTIQLEPRARQHDDAFPRSASRDLTHAHSRSASRDLSLEQLRQLAIKSMESLDLTVLPLARCGDEESKRLIDGGGVLRHRRTGSRDLRPAESKHKRTSSHHITMEPNELSLQIQKGRSVDQLSASPLDPRV